MRKFKETYKMLVFLEPLYDLKLKIMFIFGRNEKKVITKFLTYIQWKRCAYKTLQITIIIVTYRKSFVCLINGKTVKRRTHVPQSHLIAYHLYKHLAFHSNDIVRLIFYNSQTSYLGMY